MTRDAALAVGRSAHAELSFVAGGGRTVLARQFVPYPFHVTRPFRLDPARPGLSTLYLQSASGGLYRGDDLTLSLRIGSGAQAHVTTQAGTIVHDTGAAPARQRVTLHVERDAFLAFTPDPLVLMPGAGLLGHTEITLAPGAAAIVCEGFAWHDLEGKRRPFDRLRQTLSVKSDGGSCLVYEAGELDGRDFLDQASPLGPYRALASTLILADPGTLPDAARLHTVAETQGCVAGVGTLPNAAGLLVRCLGPDGGRLRAAVSSVFDEAFHALVGVPPATRPK